MLILLAHLSEHSPPPKENQICFSCLPHTNNSSSTNHTSFRIYEWRNKPEILLTYSSNNTNMAIHIFSAW